MGLSITLGSAARSRICGPESLRLRSEAGVEVVDSPDGADDVRHPYLATTDGEARPEVQPAADILE